ncbi:MAG: DUF2851 family protein [Prevotella sp.]
MMTTKQGQSEFILHYCWKHKLLPLQHLQTTDGRTVEIIDPGLHNHNAGPDFFNAKLKIDGTLWVGNVEIHDRSNDWYLHGHDKDPLYDNVILHVARVVDRAVVTEKGTSLPQMQLDAPESVKLHYRELLETDDYPPCYRIIPSLSRLLVHSWMNALETERLEQKTEAIVKRVERCGGDWEWAYFVTLARNFGFGINGDAFEQWAFSFPLHAVDHHRDDLFQIEAVFMGQAGLLNPLSLPERHRKEAEADLYYQRLCSEYHYLAHKFNLKPIDYSLWRFLRLRPQNFPHIRMSQLANLYYHRKTGLADLIETENLKDVCGLLTTSVTPYWEDHYSFGQVSEHSSKQLAQASKELLVVNTVVPMLFAYGRHKMDDRLCDRAFDYLELLKPERNHIVELWKQCGLSVESAGDSQALIQLKKEYCDKRDCLRCRFGYEYLKKGPVEG